MQHFFARSLGPGLAEFESAEEKRHASQVLRLRPGEMVALITRDGLFTAEYTQDGPMKLLSALPDPEPSVHVTLYQGIPKGDKMETIVQKCTEGGITCVVPVSMQRCVSVWRPQEAQRKTERLQKIAREAVKQCARSAVPEICAPIRVKDCEGLFSRHQATLLAWEEEKTVSISKIPGIGNACDIGIIIGPEGGITPDEADFFRQQGAVPVTLGRRILRCESAGFALLIALMTLTGNFE